MDHLFDYIDKRFRVHLLAVGVTGGHVRVVRLEHHGFSGVHLSILCFLFALFDFLFAADVSEQPRVSLLRFNLSATQ
jgi:hypothetical protein